MSSHMVFRSLIHTNWKARESDKKPIFTLVFSSPSHDDHSLPSSSDQTPGSICPGTLWHLPPLPTTDPFSPGYKPTISALWEVQLILMALLFSSWQNLRLASQMSAVMEGTLFFPPSAIRVEDPSTNHATQLHTFSRSRFLECNGSYVSLSISRGLGVGLLFPIGTRIVSSAWLPGMLLQYSQMTHLTSHFPFCSIL